MKAIVNALVRPHVAKIGTFLGFTLLFIDTWA